LQCPVQGRAADLEVPGDRGDRLASGPPGLGDGEHVIIDGGGASAAPALSLGSTQCIGGGTSDRVHLLSGGAL
jgi:hypothetical protein